MRTVAVLSMLLVVLGLATVASAVTEEGAEYESLTVVVPEGDPEAGRAAFVELSCSSCHRVAEHEELPAPVSANPGPKLGPVQAAHARVEGGSVASSILSPSHVVTRRAGDQREGKLSPMGDFSEGMTVRQLLDILAFIRTLDGEEEE